MGHFDFIDSFEVIDKNLIIQKNRMGIPPEEAVEITRLANKMGFNELNKIIQSIDKRFKILTYSGKLIKSYIAIDSDKPLVLEKLSAGTKKFIHILEKIVYSSPLEKGKMLVIDEIENGLQYNLIKVIFKVLNDENIESKKYELYFCLQTWWGKNI